jgi:O-acetyl-ADP-ribose deacetylase (regulator of RNase III)
MLDPTINAVQTLQATLQNIPMGIQRSLVLPGPLGGAQAVGIALGDMTRIPCDAYVVPHFNGAVSYGGVGAAIARSGALPGLRVYEEYVERLSQSGQGEPLQNWGDVIVSPSGGGLSSYLLNAVSVGSGDANAEFETVVAATQNALMVAAQYELDSIVLPALGTGIIGRLSDSLSAYAILGAIEVFRRARPEPTPRMVTVVLYGSLQAYDAFEEILRMGPTTERARERAMRAGARGFDPQRWQQGMELMTRTIERVRQQPDSDPKKRN